MQLAETLRTRRWQIFRPTGYHRAFTDSRSKRRNGSCTATCECAAISLALPRACEVKAAAHTRHRPPGAAGAAGSCPVPDYSAADTDIWSAASSTDASSAYCEVNDNDMYGVHSEAYPTFATQQACLFADLRAIGKVAPRSTTGGKGRPSSSGCHAWRCRTRGAPALARGASPAAQRAGAVRLVA